MNLEGLEGQVRGLLDWNQKVEAAKLVHRTIARMV